MATAAAAAPVLEPIARAVSASNIKPREQFIRELAAKYGVTKKTVWNNNNNSINTTKKEFYVIDLDECNDKTAAIIKEIWDYNISLGKDQKRVKAVPLAGWKTKTPDEGLGNLIKGFFCGLFCKNAREDRLEAEYAKSFSLNPLTSPMGADILLRYNRTAQKMHFDKTTGRFTVSPGVRITDAEAYLDSLGYAFETRMPTLHVASLIGAASNGCYGPGKNFTSMTEKIVEMKIITPQGNHKVLNAKESKAFMHLKDAHLGAGFIVTEMTFEGIVEQFKMERNNTLFRNAEEFTEGLLKQNFMDEDHFIMMYIPTDIGKETGQPRFRVTTFKRTDQDKPITKEEPADFAAYIKLVETELGEPLIDFITRSKNLQKFYPLILDVAALQTYGKEMKSTQVNLSHRIAHVFPTYTDLGICDFNIMIQTKGKDQAQELLAVLSTRLENKLKEYDKQGKVCPLFNSFARYLKGTYYPPGEGGIAHTATDHPDNRILSFELLAYSHLANTPEYKELMDMVVNCVQEYGCKYKFHHGKNAPDYIRTLADAFKDAIDQEKLGRFRADITDIIKDGNKNVDIHDAPTLTEEKINYIWGEATGRHEKSQPEFMSEHVPEHRITKHAVLKDKGRNTLPVQEDKKDKEPIGQQDQDIKYSPKEIKALGILKGISKKHKNDHYTQVAESELRRAAASAA